MTRILIVDDEDNVLQSLQRSMRQLAKDKNLMIETTSSAIAAIKRLREASFAVVISDFNMPEMSGVDFLKLTKAIQPDAIRLMLSASSDFKTLLDAINEAEVFRYLEKPWNVPDLEDILNLALQQHEQILAERHLADQSRLQTGELSAQELEVRRLEEQEPGITKVKWGPDGSVLLE
jgi:two-component system probable response regulator PhcQ